MVRLAGHYLLQFYLLWGNIKTDRPEVHLPVVVHTGNHEEYPGSLSASFPQPAQSEDDGSLVLLDHLDGVEEGEGEGGDDEKEGDDGHEVTAEAGPLFTG